VNVWVVIVLVCCVIFMSAVIDTNIDGFDKEENFEDFEKD
jgi:hypothetical protein